MEARRKQDFKKGISLDDSRRRRESNVVAIRKDKKEENLSKRRNLSLIEEGAEAEASSDSSTPVITQAGIPSNIQDLMIGLRSADSNLQFHAIQGFRKLLSRETSPPVQQCIDCGAIPIFVEYLKRFDVPKLQFEAAWALTNIASTDRTKLVVESGAVPFLVALLDSAEPDVREQVAWCLGNVAGDGASLRDIVLNANALEPLLKNIVHPANPSLLRNCVWSLSNFCRGKPQPNLDQLRPALPILGMLVSQNHSDLEAVADAVWAMSYISDGTDQRIQAIVELPGVVNGLVQLLGSEKIQVVVPALRTLGNIVSGNDIQTQTVVNANVLAQLPFLLNNVKKNIRKETCWMLSNIAAGSIDQVVRLMNTPNLIQMIMSQLYSTNDWEVRKEAAWVVSNIATCGIHSKYIHQLVEHGIIKPLCDLLEVKDIKILTIAIDAMDAILRVGMQGAYAADFIRAVEEAEGVEKLEMLQEHESEEIYKKAVGMIERYFGGEEVENDCSNGNSSFPVNPLENNENAYNFNVNTNTNNVYNFGLNTSGKSVDFNQKFISNATNVFQPTLNGLYSGM